jgi:hypothetical protein
LPYGTGVNRLIVGEVLSFKITTSKHTEQKRREIREPFQATRYETETYQADAENAEPGSSAADALIAAEASKAAEKAASKKGGKLFGKAAGFAAGKAAENLLRENEKKKVTLTRKVPRQVTEYRLRYETYSISFKKRHVEVAAVSGIFSPEAKVLEYQKELKISFDSYGSAGRPETDTDLYAAAMSRVAAEISEDLTARIREFAGYSPLKIQKYLSQGKKDAAAAECLRVLDKDPRNAAALEALRAISGN